VTGLFIAPCPFCGTTPPADDDHGGFVACRQCLADGPMSRGASFTPAEAIAAWNRRAPPLTPEAIASITKQRLVPPPGV
jgi:Lar family restriction alleviation protein